MSKIKVVVDKFPKKGEECPFSEYIPMTSRYQCVFQRGLYSRCNLYCGVKCGYLVEAKEIEED